MIVIKKRSGNRMILDNNVLTIETNDFSLLLKDDFEIIKEFIVKDNLHHFNGMELSSDDIANIIMSNDLGRMLKKYNISLRMHGLFYKLANIYLKYKNDNIFVVEANKDNLSNILSVFHNIDRRTFISGETITMYEYERILSCFNLSELDKGNISIAYQYKNSAAKPSEVYKTACAINSMTADIEKYKFSPIENVMYVYNMLKQRPYNESSRDIYASRDLHKVLFGDNIVCVGYVNVMAAILKNLNVNCIPLVIEKKGNSNGHQRGLSYIKDKCYEIDGVYVFDPTLDRKTIGNPNGTNKYFGISISTSESQMKSKIYPYLCMDFHDFISGFERDDSFRNNVKEIFELIGNNFYNKFVRIINSDSSDDVLYDLYEYVFDMYSQDDIDENTKNDIYKNIVRKIHEFNSRPLN